MPHDLSFSAMSCLPAIALATEGRSASWAVRGSFLFPARHRERLHFALFDLSPRRAFDMSSDRM